MLRSVLAVLLGWAVVIAGSVATCLAQESTDDGVERQNIERFATILERNPRRGPAFDKVYGYHLERGSLDTLVTAYQQQAEQREGIDAAARWMIVGMIEAQRGHDPQAIVALTKAEQLQPANAMAPYYLGQLLSLSGRTEEAADALERALRRKPAMADLMEIYQSLGQLYQRAQKRTEALSVWSRWEQQFPNDLRVQEQIATTLLEEEDFQNALPRFEVLARATRDKYRQSQFQVEIAEIKIRLGKTSEGIKELEALLGLLNPDNWLYRDVRRRIEAVYLKGNDAAGLQAYYEAWIDKHPEDLDAISRVAKLLIGQGNGNQAEKWLQRGLKLAPSNLPLRRTLITQLLNDRRYNESIAQYAELDRQEPNNVDTIREWGRTILKVASRPMASRQQDAALVWGKLLTIRPGDAHAALQVADLFRHAEMTDDAIKLFRRAIELAPDDVQYREYLGEYLYSLKRKDEALSVWREIATGPRESAPNVARLAEVLAQYDQLPEAIDASGQACRLDPKNLDLLLKHSALLSRAKRHEEALQHLASFQMLAVTDEERERWLQRELSELKSLDRLSGRILEVTAELERQPQQAERWYWLARAYEANNQPPEALRSIQKSVEVDSQSIPFLVTAARLNESARNLRGAVEINTRLATLNRRFRTQYLRQIANLEERLGHSEQALQAGRDLIAAAPANSEFNEFFSQLCFRLGRKDEGIQTLRLALRNNPGDVPTLLRLAAVLSEHKQEQEAVELLWRAFDRSREHSDRTAVVEQLATVLLGKGQLDSLYSRLERESRDPAKHREMTICLAHAYEAAGDPSTARKKLEPLVTDETRDTELLTYTRTLAQQQQDFEMAVRIQRQLLKLTGNDAERTQLVQLLLQAGNSEEAMELLVTNAGEQQLTAEAIKLVDTLHHRGLTKEAIARVQALRRRFPDNWELLYREANVTAASDEAKGLFVELLKLNIPVDTPSLVRRSRLSQLTPISLPIVERLASLQRMRFALQARKTPAVFVSGSNRTQAQQLQQAQQNWDPIDYGEARMYALAWLAETVGGGFIDQKFPELKTSVSREHFIDQFVVRSTQAPGKSLRDLARQWMLLSPDDLEAKIVFLQNLTGPLQPAIASQTLRIPSQALAQPAGQGGPTSVQPVKRLPSLDTKELDEAVAIYREIAAHPELVPYNVILLGGLATELTLADRQSVADELFTNVAKNASTRTEIAYLLFQQRATAEVASLPTLLDRLIAIEEHPVKASVAPAGQYSTILQFLAPERLPLMLQNRLQQSKDPDLLWAIWCRYIRLSARHANQRPAAVGVWQLPIVVPARNTVANARPPGAQPAQPQARNFMTANAVRMNQEMPAIVFDKSAAEMLKVVIDQFRLSHRTDELVSMINQQIQNTTDSGIECLYWQHTLADLLWSQNKRDQALAIFAEASERFPQRQDLRFGLALQFEAVHQMEKAFDLLESITVNTTEERRMLNSIGYRLAIASVEPTRIKRILERLADGEVPDQQLVSLATQMVKYGQAEKAEAMLLRATKDRRPYMAESRVLMDAQFGMGAMDRASATALLLLTELDRSPPGMRNLRGANGNLVEYQYDSVSDPAAERLRCYQVLQASGQLMDLIDREEAKANEMKSQADALNRLIALHQAAGHTKRVELLAIQKQKRKLDRPADRLSLALKYMETGLEYEAIDQLAILTDSEPGFLASQIRPTLEQYQGREERFVFAELLLQLDWGFSNNQLVVLPSVIDQLREVGGLESAANKLFLSMWGKHRERRIDLLQRFADERWWMLTEVQQQLSSVIVPDDSNQVPTSWTSFGRAVSRKDDFKVTGLTTVLNRWLSLAEASGKLDGPAAEIEQKLMQTPTWTGGEAILALINLRRGRVAEGVAVLKKLRPNLEKVLKYREFMAWEIGGELVRHREGLDVGADYLTLAIGLNERHDWKSAASPGVTLIDAYVKHGRTADARDLLLSQVPAGILTDTKEVVSTADFFQAVHIGSRLRSIGCPIDAIELYLPAVKRGDVTHGELVSGLSDALRELNPETMVKYVEDLDAKSPIFSLHLFAVPSRIGTRWGTVFSKISRDPELRSRFLAALERISDESPGKMAALTTTAYLCAVADDLEQATLAINKLIEADRAHSVSIAEQAKVGSALNSTGLWLVARECLTRKPLATLGEQLGQRALEASKSLDRDFTTAILKEWMLIAADAGDQAKCDLLAAELEQKP